MQAIPLVTMALAALVALLSVSCESVDSGDSDAATDFLEGLDQGGTDTDRVEGKTDEGYKGTECRELLKGCLCECKDNRYCHTKCEVLFEICVEGGKCGEPDGNRCCGDGEEPGIPDQCEMMMDKCVAECGDKPECVEQCEVRNKECLGGGQENDCGLLIDKCVAGCNDSPECVEKCKIEYEGCI